MRHNDLSRAVLAAEACSQALNALQNLKQLRSELDGPTVSNDLAHALDWLQAERSRWTAWAAEELAPAA